MPPLPKPLVLSYHHHNALYLLDYFLRHKNAPFRFLARQNHIPPKFVCIPLHIRYLALSLLNTRSNIIQFAGVCNLTLQ